VGATEVLGTAEVLPGLSALVDQSLLQREDEDLGGESRVRLLETVREYAWELLQAGGEAEDAGRAHADYYLHLAETAEPELREAAQAEWLERFEREQDNLRAALTWGHIQPDGSELRVAGGEPVGLQLLREYVRRTGVGERMEEAAMWTHVGLEPLQVRQVRGRHRDRGMQ